MQLLGIVSQTPFPLPFKEQQGERYANRRFSLCGKTTVLANFRKLWNPEAAHADAVYKALTTNGRDSLLEAVLL